MGRPPCCDKANVKRGLWTAEEDAKILAYVANHGTGNWTLVPKKAGLNRCGKSCRLRWTNYLRPDLKHEGFSPQEEDLIIELHKAIGSRWSLIAKQLPGRTDNDVKNYWNTKLKKKLMKMGIDPITHKPFSQIFSDYNNVSSLTQQTRSTARAVATPSHAPQAQPHPIIPPPMIMPMFNQFQDQLIEIQAAYPSSLFDEQEQTQELKTGVSWSGPQPDSKSVHVDEISPASSCSSSSSSMINALAQPVVSAGQVGRAELKYEGFGGAIDANNGVVKGEWCNFESESSSGGGVKETSSFVKGILDRDSELQLDLLSLNEFLDY